MHLLRLHISRYIVYHRTCARSFAVIDSEVTMKASNEQKKTHDKPWTEWKLLAYVLCVEALKYGGDAPNIIATLMPLWVLIQHGCVSYCVPERCIVSKLVFDENHEFIPLLTFDVEQGLPTSLP